MPERSIRLFGQILARTGFNADSCSKGDSNRAGRSVFRGVLCPN